MIVCHASISYSREKSLTIFAASSLTNVLPEVVEAWKKEEAQSTVFNFESSGKLAKQIELNAPANLFFSADKNWINKLKKKKIFNENETKNILSNRLIIIVHKNQSKIFQTPSFLKEAWVKHIALANENVPAGKYGREALEKNKLLSLVQGKIISGENVREALAWVSKKEAEAGIVFYTDSLIQNKIKVAYQFKKTDHSPIIYSLGVIAKSTNLKKAQDFFSFCQTKKAQNIFQKAGFELIP